MLGHLVALRPQEASAKICEAYRSAGASISDAATALGVHRESLWKYVRRLGIEGSLREIAEEARAGGWHHGRVGGRPRKATTSRQVSTKRRRAVDSRGGST
jgi:transposase-like protein